MCFDTFGNDAPSLPDPSSSQPPHQCTKVPDVVSFMARKVFLYNHLGSWGHVKHANRELLSCATHGRKQNSGTWRNNEAAAGQRIVVLSRLAVWNLTLVLPPPL